MLVSFVYLFLYLVFTTRLSLWASVIKGFIGRDVSLLTGSQRGRKKIQRASAIGSSRFRPRLHSAIPNGSLFAGYRDVNPQNLIWEISLFSRGLEHRHPKLMI